MPPAARITCEVPGCQLGPIPDDPDAQRGPYVTHVECKTRAEVVEDLKIHIEMAHTLPMKNAEIATKQQEADTNKLLATNTSRDSDSVSTNNDHQRFNEKRDPIPRPKINTNASESDWSFFCAQWERYTAGSNMSQQQQLHQLWAACSEELQRGLHNGGQGQVSDPATLLVNIKVLAVKKLNNLVNVVHFQEMKQFSDETIAAFGTRLNGHANVCDFYTECPNPACDNSVSFREKMILFQFLKGLNDTHAQERILEASAQQEGGELGLAKAMKLAESFEMSKKSSQIVNTAKVSKISEHPKNKNSTRQDIRKTNKKETSCGNCGKDDHTSKLNDRRKNCKAFDKQCTKCNTNGHYANMCRGGPRESRDKSQPNRKDGKDTKLNEVKADTAKEPTQEADLGTLSGSWFKLSGSQELSSAKSNLSPSAKLLAFHKSDSARKLRHHIMNKFGEWVPSNVQPHGKVQLTLEVDNSAAKQLGIEPLHHCKPTMTSALADTGAQMCVADWQVGQRLGLQRKDLMVPAL